MTSRPRLFTSRTQVFGLLALALFVVMAAAFLTAEFDSAAGFGGESTTATIGFAILNIEGPLPSEGFLVPFEIIDVVLVAALAAAVMLAKREYEEGGILSDGGERDDRGGER